MCCSFAFHVELGFILCLYLRKFWLSFANTARTQVGAMDVDPEHDGGGGLKTQLTAYFETVSWKSISTDHFNLFVFHFLGCKPP